LLQDVGTAALDDTDLDALNRVKNSMSSVYNMAKICPFNKQNCDPLTDPDRLTLDPEIENTLASSEDYDEMKYIWEKWHEKTGKLMRNDYKTYVDLMNKAAKANKYQDAGEMWRAKYEDKKLIEKVDELWKVVEPLYNELHKYVKNELRYMYGPKMNPKDKNIPAHLLGEFITCFFLQRCI
jgi:peptidyl-dipeptidase A